MNKLIVSLTLLATLATASPLPDFPFVTASGTAEIKIAPDMAVMTFTAEVLHQDSGTAVAAIRKTCGEVILFLKNQGITDSAITAFELDKRAVRKSNQSEIVRYEVSRNFKLRIDDLTKYETIANTLFKKNNIIRIDSTFERRDRSKIESDLQTAACTATRDNAIALASGFGGKIGDVYCISQSGFDDIDRTFLFNSAWGTLGCPAGVYGASDFFEEDQSQPLFIPATITLRNSVNVLFRLQ